MNPLEDLFSMNDMTYAAWFRWWQLRYQAENPKRKGTKLQADARRARNMKRKETLKRLHKHQRVGKYRSHR